MSRRGAHSSASASGLDAQPPPFLTKTYDLVSDPATDDIVSWSNGGKSFTVWKNEDFSRELLGKFFKHNNFSSFVRQLNTYGFRKVDSDRWEFYEENFQQGRRDLLHQIHRRKPSAPPAGQVARTAIEVGQFGGIADEIDGLKRDKNVLMVELVRLRQQQAQADHTVRQLQQRVEVAEARQNQMMAFLSKALQNPGMLQQLVSSRQSIGRLENGGNSGRTQRKKLKRRASKAGDELHSDQESGEQMSDGVVHQAGSGGMGNNANMSTALVQYSNQHSQDFAAMLRGYPEISEVPSPAQSGSGGAEAVGGWEADLGGMGNAFGGMQLSNSAGIVRASPVPSNVTIFEQMDGSHGPLAPQPGASLGMPAIPTMTSSPLDATGGYRLGGAGGGFQNPLPPPAMLGNGPVGGVPTVAASPLSRRSGGGGGGQGTSQRIEHSALQPEGSVASDSMLSAVGGAPSDVPAVTSVPISVGFPSIPASAAAVGSPQQPFAGIKPEPTGDTALRPTDFGSFAGRDQSTSLPAGLPNGGAGAGLVGATGVGGSGGSYGFDDFKLDLLKAPSGPADFMGDDDLWEQFMATSPVGPLGMLDAAVPETTEQGSASKA